MKKELIIIVIIALSAIANSQNISSLHVVTYTVTNFNVQKPLVLYLSGDGGKILSPNLL